jgi:hypothetical protein
MTKDDKDKPRFTLVPQKALLVVARIMTGGAKKYGDYNWKQDSGDGKDVARLLDAAGRHLNSHNMGERIDESGQPHLGHAICSLMMALEREMDAEGNIEDVKAKRDRLIANIEASMSYAVGEMVRMDGCPYPLSWGQRIWPF